VVLLKEKDPTFGGAFLLRLRGEGWTDRGLTPRPARHNVFPCYSGYFFNKATLFLGRLGIPNPKLAAYIEKQVGVFHPFLSWHGKIPASFIGEIVNDEVAGEFFHYSSSSLAK
jgi:hypothetical protein